MSQRDLAPIILVPGLAGSRLQAVNNTTKETVDCWVPKISCSMWDVMAQYLWGYYSQTEERYVSWCEPQWEIKAVGGIAGVEWLSSQSIKHFPLIGNQVSYFHQLLRCLRKAGYVDELNLFAFSYDWRQDPTGQYIQDQFSQLLKRVSDSNNGKKMKIFGHSMGGIVIKQFCQNQPELADKYIDSVITGGTPYNGCNAEFLIAAFRGYALHLPLNKQLMRGIIGCTPCVYALIPHSCVTGTGHVYVTNTCAEKHELQAQHHQLIDNFEQIVAQMPPKLKNLVRNGHMSDAFSDVGLAKLYAPVSIDSSEVSSTPVTQCYTICDGSLVDLYERVSAEQPNFLYNLFRVNTVEMVRVRERISTPLNTRSVKFIACVGSGYKTHHVAKYVRQPGRSLSSTLQFTEPTYEDEDGDGTVVLSSQKFFEQAEIIELPHRSHSELKGKYIFEIMQQKWNIQYPQSSRCTPLAGVFIILAAAFIVLKQFMRQQN